MGAKQRNLIGLRYNMLIVLESLPSTNLGTSGYKKRMWLCKCDCGNLTKAATGDLTGDHKKSCGCLTATKSAQNSINSRHKIAKQDAGYRSIYSSYKGNARSRELNFNVDFDYAVSIMKSNCHYCGIEPSNIYMKSYYNATYNGIDRVDNTKGYENDNVVSCCKMCNIAKNNNTEQEFITWISRAYHHQNNKMIVRKKMCADAFEWLEQQLYKTKWDELTHNEKMNIFGSARLMANL